MKPIALVTGANRGIGRAVVEQLADRGFIVLLGTRDLNRGEHALDELSAPDREIELLHLDVSDDDSVAQAVAQVDARYGRIDVLVNNAAVKYEFHPCPPRGADLAVVRATYATNVFGLMSVLLGFVPLLQRSDAGRIVNMSSSLGSLGLAVTDGSVYRERNLLGYSTSKTVVNAVTVQFANDLRDTRVKVNAVDPGYVDTEMTKGDGTVPAKDAAAVVVRYATLPDDGPTGGFFDDLGPVPW